MSAAVVYPITVVLLLFGVRLFQRRSRLPLPPGPPKLPIIGNVFNAPTSGRLWEVYHQWAVEYDTDILHLDVLGQSIVVLDSYETAIELFERRGAKYSSRAPMIMATELMGWKLNIGLLPYGSELRAQRKMLHESFNDQAVKQFHPALLNSTHKLLEALLTTPEDYMQHLHQLVAVNGLATIYGLDGSSISARHIECVDRTAKAVADALTPGAFLVDILPILRHVPGWFPGAGFQRQAKSWKDEANAIKDDLMETAQEQMRKGKSSPSLVHHVMNRSDLSESSFESLRNLGVATYNAALETSLPTLLTFILAMVLHPEVQQKAQDELDRVIPEGRLPSFEDQNNLPYVSAIIKECTRWNVAAPVGIPHFIEVEDEYKGYRIPARSIIIANAWAMLHNEADYPDSSTFNPERFMKDSVLDPDVQDPSNCIFGFGRRICPGRYQALSAIYITVASILAAYTIGPELDPAGHPILPVVEFGYQSSVAMYPKPFKCSIKPRSMQVSELIRAATQC